MEEQRKLQLTNRRTTLMASLGRAEQFVSRYQAERDQAQVPLRIENIDHVWMGLEEVQTELEEVETTDEGREQNLQTRSKFESVYFKVKAALKSLLPVIPNPTRSAIPNPPANLLSGIKLPTISLPEFDGDYNQWLTFHDTFVALIHSNADVPDVQKFHYLRAAVKGEAAQLIESIAISAANYSVAWQTLTTRYANDYLLKKRHLQALLDCPRMKKESAEALHSLVDEYQRHTKILRQLNEPVDQWSTILEHLLCIRLDDGTLKAWEDHATTVADPNFNCLVDFLQRRIRVLESMSVNHQAHNLQTPVNQIPTTRRPFYPKVATYTAIEDPQPQCYACDQHHFLIKCPRFEKMNVSDRMRLVDTNRLCQNCFRHDHFARNCQSKYSCRHCQRRHHTLLHAVNSFNESFHQPSASRFSNQAIHTPMPSANRNTAPSATYTCTNSTSQGNNPSLASNSNVLLSTVALLIVDSNGQIHPARALLDSGSQSNIMSERLCRLLKLKQRAVNIPVHGVGDSASNVKHSVHSTIRSRKGDFEIDLDFLVLPRITMDLPAVTFPACNWRIPNDLFLADPSFNKTGAIDLLLGAEHFYTFVNPGTKIERDQQNLLVESVFGWIVVGKTQTLPTPQATACHVSMLDSPQDKVEFSNVPRHPVEEQRCKPRLAENYTRTPESCYMVRLPHHYDFDQLRREMETFTMRQNRSVEKPSEQNFKLKQVNFTPEYQSMDPQQIIPLSESKPLQTTPIPRQPVGNELGILTKFPEIIEGSRNSNQGPLHATDNQSDQSQQRPVMVAAVHGKPRETHKRKSSFIHLVRVAFYCRRLINACRRRRSSDQPEGSTANSIDEEDRVSSGGQSVSKQSHLRLLSPVRGRQKLSEQPYHTKYPILFPSSHPSTRSVATYYQLQIQHGGGRAQLPTLLTPIEVCMNTKRLSTMNKTPDNLAITKPACFQAPGTSNPDLPEADVTSVLHNQLDHNQKLHERNQHFWCNWRTNESSPPVRWLLAWITESQSSCNGFRLGPDSTDGRELSNDKIPNIVPKKEELIGLNL